MSTEIIVTESDIDAIHEEMAVQQGQDERLLTKFANQQPHITGWLLGDDFKLLLDDEQDLLFFLAMCIYEACARKTGVRDEISGEEIREAEEANWSLLENSNAKAPRERIDLFFESSNQEDLLAFIEDSLEEDEDDPDTIVTKLSREPMFVALKSLVDVLI